MHRKQLDFLPWSAESFCRFPLIGHQARRSAVPATVTLQGCFHDSLRCSVGNAQVCADRHTSINTQACMCLCAHTCIARHTQAHMSVWPCVFLCPHKYKSVHVQHTCGSAHKNVHIRMHTYPRVCVYPCADACAHCTRKNMHVHFMHTSAHACMCLCMYTDVLLSASLSFANLQAP